eukprot:TRINITY_DN21647_c0_g1_i1.p1 TRINITY_DN21647_c0_g1~~TRINITY_DN21647_c0_g1_i1.p1  ORF type:complete len:498 (+),score=78.99 TRINITY_DN21647_c0_g1_i1:25-1518(+)
MSGEGSRFVTCPVCHKIVPSHRINAHLDAKCSDTQLNSPARKQASQATLRPPPLAAISLDEDEAPALVPAKQLAPIFSQQEAVPPGVAEQAAKRPRLEAAAPLAERVRPRTLEDFVGQELGALSALIESDRLCSFVLWGPPGTGKTTLAGIVAERTKARFFKLSAVSARKEDVSRIVQQATSERKRGTSQRTILFLDECHRFTKLQQDSFLPYVEDGTIIFIGATTENPSFTMNNALLSRARVFVLKKLESQDVELLLRRALRLLEEPAGRVTDKAIAALALLADGDARSALNSLELGLAATAASKILDAPDISRFLQRKHTLVYDRNGDQHYNLISALHKSIRGSDADAALYWLGRMIEGGEDPMYIARRLIRIASEDVGIADPQALVQAVAASQACHAIGLPECKLALAQCAVYLARAPRSNELDRAYQLVEKAIRDEPTADPPLHILNAPTRLMRDMGYGKGYIYYGDDSKQTYLPSKLIGRTFLDPPPKSAAQ